VHTYSLHLIRLTCACAKISHVCKCFLLIDSSLDDFDKVSKVDGGSPLSLSFSFNRHLLDHRATRARALSPRCLAHPGRFTSASCPPSSTELVAVPDTLKALWSRTPPRRTLLWVKDTAGALVAAVAVAAQRRYPLRISIASLGMHSGFKDAGTRMAALLSVTTIQRPHNSNG